MSSVASLVLVSEKGFSDSIDLMCLECSCLCDSPDEKINLQGTWLGERAKREEDLARLCF